MKLFSLIRPKLLRRRELRRLKKQVFEDPTPEGVRDLAHRLVWASETEEALRVVEEGVERFPESDSLKSFLVSFKKNRRRETIDRLLQLLETRPLPEVYGQLAEIYRDVGELDQALEICQRCDEKFPESDIPFLVRGRIGLDRFKRTLTVRAGRFAIDNFMRAIAIDRFNLRAHIYLAELYTSIGASASALSHLETIAHQSVLDDHLTRLERMARVSSRTTESMNSEDVDSLLIQAETTETLVYNPWQESNRAERSQRTQHEQDAARHEMAERFGSLQGSKGLSLILGRPTDSEDARGLDAVVAQIASVGDASARKMDLGNMSGVYISGDFGHLVIRKVRSATAAIHCEDESVARSLREPLQDFLVRHFG